MKLKKSLIYSGIATIIVGGFLYYTFAAGRVYEDIRKMCQLDSQADELREEFSNLGELSKKTDDKSEQERIRSMRLELLAKSNKLVDESNLIMKNIEHKTSYILFGSEGK